MAKRIFKENNYIAIDEDAGGAIFYIENTALLAPSDLRFQIDGHLLNFTIPFSESGEWYDEAGTTAYTEETLRDFLTTNTNVFRNGGGNGDGVSKIGFIYYNDTTGSVSLTANTWTDIPNNGLGLSTNKTYKPDDVTELLDVSTGYIDTSELDLGDTILIRNDYEIIPTTNNALLEFRYELGTGASVKTEDKIVSRLDAGSGIPYQFNLNTDLITMDDLNIKDNAIKLQVKLSTNGSLLNTGSRIQLIKRDMNV